MRKNGEPLAPCMLKPVKSASLARAPATRGSTVLGTIQNMVDEAVLVGFSRAVMRPLARKSD